MHSVFEHKTAQLLSYADIKINGNRRWDIHVHDERFYKRVLADGSLGLGESYMQGWWDCKAIDELFFRIIKAELPQKIKYNKSLILSVIKSRLFNMQSISRAFHVGKLHYNIGNDIFKSMLDKYMIYSCGYWKNSSNLNQAQQAKLDLVCRKLRLKPGMNLLDIGCGWGGFAKYAAEKYSVSVTGLTVSGEQAKFAREFCKGLPVTVKLIDYRNFNGKFDRIASIGMFEHVGYKNYGAYMKKAGDCLKDDGLFLLHTIGSKTSKTSGDPWLEKYIFPNGMIPSMKQISAAAEGIFVIEDIHNFGADYDKTLMAWHSNFKKNWDKLKSRYDQKFCRMWSYYLLSCAGLFRAWEIQLWQIVFSKNGVPEVYNSIR